MSEGRRLEKPSTIRSAEPSDREAILGLVTAAFTSPGHDSQEEVDIVADTWASGAGLDDLELVAMHDEDVVGHVLGARGDLGGRVVVAVAPLCVASSDQGRGIGSALMTELLSRAETQRWPLVALLGDPDYYGRFGFEPSGPLGIHYRPVGLDNPHFQVRRLGSFDRSVRGEFRYCWETPTD
jgi:putative acetyltransferase